MNEEAISYNTVVAVHDAVVPILILILPAWLVFRPPQRTRSWRPLYRFLLPIISAQVGIYALFYAFVFPASAAVLRAHPGALLCGVVFGPSYFWLPIILVSGICFAIRAATHPNTHATPSPTSRIA